MQDEMTYSNIAPLGIVVLSYNGLNYSLKCIESLLLVESTPRELVLVDNASTDGSDQEFRKRYENDSRITLILLDRNLGYTGGMNIGIRHLLKDKEIKVILLLNNDTVVRPNFLSSLMECLKDGSGYHIATPKILCEDEQTIWSAGERVFYPLLFSLRTKGKQDSSRFNEPRKINSVTGCAMAVRRKMFEKIGLFDENYFRYVEEIDFCRQALKAGFSFAYCPQSVILHRGSGLWGEFSPTQVYLNVRNKAYFIKKNGLPFLWPISVTWYFLVVGFWRFKAILRKRPDVANLIFLGWWDFCRGKMGPPHWIQKASPENNQT